MKLTYEVIFLSGNPYGGPDRVSYGSRSSAIRSARVERAKGLKVQVRKIAPFVLDDETGAYRAPLGLLVYSW